jgi:FG-GAP-like repeat/FG-GAP repeat
MRYQTAPNVAGVWLTLLGMFTLSASSLAQAPAFRHNTPTPYVDLISPTAARMNGSGFILILNGTGFQSNAQIGFQVGNTTEHLPAFVANSTEVAAYVPASSLRKAATATVTVINGQTPGLVGTSNPVLLPITIPTASVSFNQTNITLGQSPDAIVTGDFNGDGKLDLAISEPCGSDPTCTNYNGNIAILLGNGDGTFTAAASPAVNQFPGALAVGDFNGDGKTDIAVLNFTGSSVTILLGNGHGGFTAAPSSPAVGGNPDSIAVGDLNGDGKLDLAVVNFEDSDVSILLGNGDGSFTAAAYPTVGSQPGTVFLGDTNGDGKLDLVVNTDFSPFVNILLGRGDGTFIAAPTPTAPTGSLALSDVNRDGKLDLVFAEGNAPGFAQTTISVALGNGNGTFRTGPTSPVVNAGLSGGLLADFNGDGKLDLAGEVGYPSNSYDFFLGDGHGTFNLTNSIDVSNYFNGPAVVGDFNADGRLDLATLNQTNGGTVSILLQAPQP